MHYSKCLINLNWIKQQTELNFHVFLKNIHAPLICIIIFILLSNLLNLLMIWGGIKGKWHMVLCWYIHLLLTCLIIACATFSHKNLSAYLSLVDCVIVDSGTISYSSSCLSTQAHVWTYRSCPVKNKWMTYIALFRFLFKIYMKNSRSISVHTYKQNLRYYFTKYCLMIQHKSLNPNSVKLIKEIH